MQKITKEMVDRLSLDTITKKEYNETVALITERVDEIWRFIIKCSKGKLDWYAFTNDVSYGHGDGSSGGEFDPDVDKEFIEFIGDFDNGLDHKDYKYSDGFPTELLWTDDYKTVVKDHTNAILKKIQEDKERTKVSRQKSRESRENLKESIKSKLIKEELAIVKWK